jgi:Domain of unknown function (DUF3470).
MWSPKLHQVQIHGLRGGLSGGLLLVGENMLSSIPDECIDCGVCEPECPAEAIVPDSDDKAAAWLEKNRDFAIVWPNITRKGAPPDDADEWKDKPGKAALFSAEPGVA